MSTKKNIIQEHNNETNKMDDSHQPDTAAAEASVAASPEEKVHEWFDNLSPQQKINLYERHHFEPASSGKQSKKQKVDEYDSSLRSPSACEGTPVRDDLSGDYLEGHGKSPVDRLEQELKMIIEEHQEAAGADGCPHNSDVAAPFLCVLQSTGYGKTRAILELAKRKKLVYLVLKDLYNSWRKPAVVNSILNEIAGEHAEEFLKMKWTKFLTAVDKCARQTKYDKLETFNDAQVTKTKALGNFFVDLADFWMDERTPEKSPLRGGEKFSLRGCLKQEKSNEAPSHDDKQHSGQRSDSEDGPDEKHVKFDDKTYAGATPITDQSLVVCFDEVSALKDGALRALRRAAKHKGIILIFSDTAASICKVMNPDDHSSKDKCGILGRFVPPIFSLNTTDLDWNRVDGYNDYEHLFGAGRPRWKSHLAVCGSDSEDRRIDSLIKLATNLLTQQAGDDLESNDKQLLQNKSGSSIVRVDPGKIALFACRFSLGPRSKLSSMLVKHSLATVIGVSEQRDVVCATYPSEPILAEASAKYTKEEEKLDLVLENVKAAFHGNNKMLEPPRGDVGEMCAAALLGYAMDYIRSSKGHKYMSQTVQLMDLLELVYHSCNNFKEDATVKSTVTKWDVNFTHFVRPSWQPSEHDLENMWNRRMAYYVPDGCKGLDMLIPLQNQESKHKYGTLRVQVKNYSHRIHPCECKKYLEKLHPSQCPPKMENEPFSVGLVLSVNEIHECYQLLSGPDQTHCNQKQENQQSLKNPVLQLAASFEQKGSPLHKLAEKLKEVCSQNTAKKIEMDLFFEEGTKEKIEETKKASRETRGTE